MYLKFEILIFATSICVSEAYNSLNSFSINETTQATATAVLDVIDTFYVKNDIHFDIILNKESLNYSQKILASVLSQSEGNFSYNILHQNLITPYGVLNPSVFFINYCYELSLINHNYIVGNNYPKQLKYLIYIENCSMDYLIYNMNKFIKRPKLNIYRSQLEVYEYILIHNENNIHLITYEWFTKLLCNFPSIMFLNTFNKLRKKWKRPFKAYEKFQDFHNCELVMVLPVEKSLWGSITIDRKTGTKHTSGVGPQMFEALAKNLNFRPFYQAATLAQDSSFFIKNDHIDNRLLPDNDELVKSPNVFFDIVQLVSVNKSGVHMTPTFLEVKDIILVTPGELYSPYEKLSLPFDRITWILLIATFLIAFLSIFVINQFPKIVQNIFYGEKIQTPSLNVLSIFFGIAHHKLPKKHFARFILILFVFFCLIFRTCYQSKMFEFLTSQPRKEPPKSVEDLLERNYSLYLSVEFKQLKEYVSHEKNKWPEIVILPNEYHKRIVLFYSQNSSAKSAIIIQEHAVQYYESMSKKFLRWLTLKDTSFQVTTSGFAFNGGNFFFGVVEKATQRFIENGIMAHMLRNTLQSKIKYVKIKENKVLSVDDLSFGFVIWLVSCGISVLIFLIEMLIWALKFKSKRRNGITKIKRTRVKILKVHPSQFK